MEVGTPSRKLAASRIPQPPLGRSTGSSKLSNPVPAAETSAKAPTPCAVVDDTRPTRQEDQLSTSPCGVSLQRLTSEESPGTVTVTALHHVLSGAMVTAATAQGHLMVENRFLRAEVCI